MDRHARTAHVALLKLLIRIALFLGLVGSGVLLLASWAEAEERKSSSRFHTSLAYQQTCSRCHEAEPASKHSDAEWEQLLQRMDGRAHLTTREHREMLAYLESMN